MLNITTLTNDYLTLGTWDFNDDPVYAEDSDPGNTSGWGLNTNLRNIFNAITDIHQGFILEPSAVEPPQLSGFQGIWYNSVDDRITFKGSLLTSNLATMKDLEDATFALDWQEAVLDRHITDPSTLTPSDGERYIVAVGAIGDWAGHDNEIAQYNGGTSSWDFFAPTEGWACYSDDENYFVYYNGSAWVLWGGIPDHNALGSIQGGAPTEYYHLTAAQHTALTGLYSGTTIYADNILEKTLNAGVGIDGSFFIKDGYFYIGPDATYPSMSYQILSLEGKFARFIDAGINIERSEPRLYFTSTDTAYTDGAGDSYLIFFRNNRLNTVATITAEHAGTLNDNLGRLKFDVGTGASMLTLDGSLAKATFNADVLFNYPVEFADDALGINLDLQDTLKVDTIREYNTDAGVFLEDVFFKDEELYINSDKKIYFESGLDNHIYYDSANSTLTINAPNKGWFGDVTSNNWKWYVGGDISTGVEFGFSSNATNYNYARLSMDKTEFNMEKKDTDFFIYGSGVTSMSFDCGLNMFAFGASIPNEKVTVDGRLSLIETTAPTQTAGYGKFYVKSSDSKPYFMDDSGNEDVLIGSINQFNSNTGTITTTSATDVLMTDLSLTISKAGDYLISAGFSLQHNQNGAISNFSIYVNGVQQANSEKTFFRPLQDISIPVGIENYKVTVGAGQVVDIRWKTAGGTLTSVGGRHITALKV